MTIITVQGGRPLRGAVGVPGDKSITHRALLLGGLAQGASQVRGALLEGDCRATLGCLRALGIQIAGVARAEQDPAAPIVLAGRGLRGLGAPAGPLDCVRSGTTMRLLAGVMAGQSFDSVLDAHPQLAARPMRRVTEPLRRMGAQIEDADGRAPLRIAGRPLRGMTYATPMASAQVKSAILLAGLYAEGDTTVQEPAPSRDHTERMLRAMGADLRPAGVVVSLTPGRSLAPLDILVPGDISSAAFLLAAGVLTPGSDLIIRNVGVNPTRTGALDVLRQMGADVTVLDERQAGGEPVGDLRARSSDLRGVEIAGALIPRLIDELPILAVVATQAHGTTTIRDAAELRVKETDRIEGIAEPLRRLGARIETLPDGMIIEGPTPLRGTAVSGQDDHRLAMALLIAGLFASGATPVAGAGFIADSYPGFIETLRQLGASL